MKDLELFTIILITLVLLVGVTNVLQSQDINESKTEQAWPEVVYKVVPAAGTKDTDFRFEISQDFFNYGGALPGAANCTLSVNNVFIGNMYLNTSALVNKVLNIFLNVNGSHLKSGNNNYTIILKWYFHSDLLTFVCEGNGPFVYGVTPTPTITPTPTKTPIPMFESWIPFWQVNNDEGFDTFLSLSNNNNVIADGALDFYINDSKLTFNDSFILNPYEIKTLSVKNTLDISISNTEPYHGVIKMMSLGGEINAFTAIHKKGKVLFTIDNSELLSSPAKLPFWQVLDGAFDTEISIFNPNENDISMNLTFHDQNGDELLIINDYTLPSTEISFISLLKYIELYGKVGSAKFDWQGDSKITIFTLIKNEITGEAFPVEVK